MILWSSATPDEPLERAGSSLRADAGPVAAVAFASCNLVAAYRQQSGAVDGAHQPARCERPAVTDSSCCADVRELTPVSTPCTHR